MFMQCVESIGNSGHGCLPEGFKECHRAISAFVFQEWDYGSKFVFVCTCAIDNGVYRCDSCDEVFEDIVWEVQKKCSLQAFLYEKIFSDKN